MLLYFFADGQSSSLNNEGQWPAVLVHSADKRSSVTTYNRLIGYLIQKNKFCLDPLRKFYILITKHNYDTEKIYVQISKYEINKFQKLASNNSFQGCSPSKKCK